MPPKDRRDKDLERLRADLAGSLDLFGELRAAGADPMDLLSGRLPPGVDALARPGGRRTVFGDRFASRVASHDSADPSDARLGSDPEDDRDVAGVSQAESFELPPPTPDPPAPDVDPAELLRLYARSSGLPPVHAEQLFDAVDADRGAAPPAGPSVPASPVSSDLDAAEAGLDDEVEGLLERALADAAADDGLPTGLEPDPVDAASLAPSPTEAFDPARYLREEADPGGDADASLPDAADPLPSGDDPPDVSGSPASVLPGVDPSDPPLSPASALEPPADAFPASGSEPSAPSPVPSEALPLDGPATDVAAGAGPPPPPVPLEELDLSSLELGSGPSDPQGPPLLVDDPFDVPDVDEPPAPALPEAAPPHPSATVEPSSDVDGLPEDPVAVEAAVHDLVSSVRDPDALPGLPDPPIVVASADPLPPSPSSDPVVPDPDTVSSPSSSDPSDPPSSPASLGGDSPEQISADVERFLGTLPSAEADPSPPASVLSEPVLTPREEAAVARPDRSSSPPAPAPVVSAPADPGVASVHDPRAVPGLFPDVPEGLLPDPVLSQWMAHSLALAPSDPRGSVLAGLLALCAHLHAWVGEDVVLGTMPRDEHWADAVVALLRAELHQRIHAVPAAELPDVLRPFRPARGMPVDDPDRIRAAAELLRRLGAVSRDSRRESALRHELLQVRNDPVRGTSLAFLDAVWPRLPVALRALHDCGSLLLTWADPGRPMPWTGESVRKHLGLSGDHLFCVVATPEAVREARLRVLQSSSGVMADDASAGAVDRAMSLGAAVGVVPCAAVEVLASGGQTPGSLRVTPLSFGVPARPVDLPLDRIGARCSALAGTLSATAFHTLLCAPRAACPPPGGALPPGLHVAPMEDDLWFLDLLRIIDCEGLCVL